MIFRKKQDSHSSDKGPPPLSRNLISYVGWLICCMVTGLLVILIAADLLFHWDNVYNSMVTYMLVPTGLLGGAAIVLGGILLEWRRRHRHTPEAYAPLPVVDFNIAWQRRRMAIGMMLLSLLLGVSVVITYHAYHFTESPEFCGKVCHMVMNPEYTTHEFSPHSRVACVQCHIGPGAQWYVKAKLSGLRQVWATVTHTYHLPIQTPIENLRPARETCEQCHWPDKFLDSLVKVVWHFSPDEANTPIRYTMQMKIGGGDPQLGLGRGIHWHINPAVTVRYWQRDKKRQDIPWVEVQETGKPPRVYSVADGATSPSLHLQPPEGAEMRVMDCVDCHNRPSHIYQSPQQVIDSALSTGILDGSLPYLKRYATQLFEAKYPNNLAAQTAIREELNSKYATRVQGPRGAELLKGTEDELLKLYERSFFPDQGVDWRGFPDHKGHLESPGCDRCHDGKHLDADAKPIPNNCDLCHSLLDQAEGEAAFKPAVFQQREFIHPRNLGDIWKGYQCWECHRLSSVQLRDNPQWNPAAGSPKGGNGKP